ncbi:MAG: hypothetical protein EOO38_12245 [Cytophagaceae bacterium]|nr:MAG: hypothetical protein EOO38_12245 [Cytophagaceae bacterium]
MLWCALIAGICQFIRGRVLQGQKVFVQYNTENSDLEAQANALLGDAGEEALVQGDDDEEFPIDVTELVEEEDDEDKSPKMFGGAKAKTGAKPGKKKPGLH